MDSGTCFAMVARSSRRRCRLFSAHQAAKVVKGAPQRRLTFARSAVAR